MNDQLLLAKEKGFPRVHSESFSQYLSFRFYRENLDNFKDRTKDSINNFLKSVSEIEDEFVAVLKTQETPAKEFNDFEYELAVAYMEENY